MGYRTTQEIPSKTENIGMQGFGICARLHQVKHVAHVVM